MRVWREEVFAPVLPVRVFKTIDEAIALSNDTIYGLGGYVFTKDKTTFETISTELNTGAVSHNGISYSAPFNPFGGTKKSGNTRIRGIYGFRGLCNVKVITFDKGV